MLTHGDLFSGIGGFALAARWMGWQTKYFVEWNPWAQGRLAMNFPGVPIHSDVTKVHWSREHRVDVLTGGFPCQPFSYAGKRKGTEDDRWLWPAIEHAVRILRPRFVVLENVPGLLDRGMHAVLGSLAEVGYDARWQVVSAAQVGALHRRDRVWIVGYASGGRRAGIARRRAGAQLADGHAYYDSDGRGAGERGAVADAERDGRTGHAAAEGGEGWETWADAARRARALADGGGQVVPDADREQREAGGNLRSDGGQGSSSRRTGDVAGRREVAVVADAPGVDAQARHRRRRDVRAQEKDGQAPDNVASRNQARGRFAAVVGRPDATADVRSAGRRGGVRRAVDVADAERARLQGYGKSDGVGEGRRAAPEDVAQGCCGGAHPEWGHCTHWLVEPAVGRVVDGVSERIPALEALGNAIVPQVAYAWAYQQVKQLVAQGY